MAKIQGVQLSLITEIQKCGGDVGDGDKDELGTNDFLVPNCYPPELGTNDFLVPNFSTSQLGTNEKLGTNSPQPELGTKDSLVPNSDELELGTQNSLVPNSEEWKPPIGCLQQKWIKDHQYWYWRYYNLKGKKASLYLAKDYNKAIRKAIKIGVPPDAKLPNHPPSDPQTQTPTPTTQDHLDLAPAAYRASKDRAAA